ncbi:MAG: hypothetical protein KAR00_00960 [Candidatus Pacebacteria bacterium]|nr:hypothetical protein [Candidatus Paceibacterota bacterium]
MVYQICTKEPSALALDALKYSLMRRNVGNAVSLGKAAEYAMLQSGYNDPTGEIKYAIVAIMKHRLNEWKKQKKEAVGFQHSVRVPKNGHWKACPND